jgi:hypothetical protein
MIKCKLTTTQIKYKIKHRCRIDACCKIQDIYMQIECFHQK